MQNLQIDIKKLSENDNNWKKIRGMWTIIIYFLNMLILMEGYSENQLFPKTETCIQ